MSPITSKILKLGDPGLRVSAKPVRNFQAPSFLEQADTLDRALVAFREEFGFGRAISAPQLGIPYRFIAMNLGRGAFLVVNPEIVWTSEETVSLWDDCMSFPWLMVRLRRHASISVRYQDENGAFHEMCELDTATSELFQHEIDHLDGILAVDRALDRNALVSRELFLAQPETFFKTVDWVPNPKKP